MHDLQLKASMGEEYDASNSLFYGNLPLFVKPIHIYKDTINFVNGAKKRIKFWKRKVEKCALSHLILIGKL